MKIRIGCELRYMFPAPTPMIAILTVHYTRAGDLEWPDHLTTSPVVPIEGYRDSFGNWCCRLVAPAGHFTMGTNAVIRDDLHMDRIDRRAVQHKVQDLPADTLLFLLGSRYCETDLLSERAWQMFGQKQRGWSLVQAVCDFVHEHIAFDYMQARVTRTAAEAFTERKGVCRDYAHLAITLLRCLNIPARYCTGYVSDIGQPPPYAEMDFAAWIEVFLGHQWHVFDPRNNAPRIGRILIARGRDAADVALTHTFGANTLVGFKVITEEAMA
jgi:transglutaminase-like putative cysteine protease